MRELTNIEKRQLEQHQLWLESKHKEGARLNWSGAYLGGINLVGANLQGANLRKADLRGAFHTSHYRPISNEFWILPRKTLDFF